MKNNWRRVFVMSVFASGVLSLFASSFPDGLEKIAQTQGFLEKEKQLFSGIIPDYQMPLVHNSSLAMSFAGIVGTCMVFGILFFIGKAIYYFEGEEDIVRR